MRQEGLAVPHRQHSARVQLVTGWVFGESLQSPELPPWNFHLCTFLGIAAPVNLSSIQCTDIVDYFKSFVNHGLLDCLLSDLPPSRSPYTFKETLSSPPLGACYHHFVVLCLLRLFEIQRLWRLVHIYICTPIPLILFKPNPSLIFSYAPAL